MDLKDQLQQAEQITQELKTGLLGSRVKRIALIVVAVLLVVASLSGAWYLWKPKKVPDNKPASAVAQSDGSVVIEKRPDPKHKPEHKIPSGGKVERDVTVTVKPTAPPVAGKCPDVKVNLSLVRLEDKTKRVVASSPSGAVVGGLDIPVEDAEPLPEPKLWAVGGVASTRGNYGAFVDRDFGWIRTGVQVNSVKDEHTQAVSGLEAWGKIGIRF